MDDDIYLDTADSFMGLGHADRLGWILIRQHLSAAKVVSSKDDPINKIFWLTWTWDCAAYALIVKHCKELRKLQNVEDIMRLLPSSKLGKAAASCVFFKIR